MCILGLKVGDDEAEGWAIIPKPGDDSQLMAERNSLLMAERNSQLMAERIYAHEKIEFDNF